MIAAKLTLLKTLGSRNLYRFDIKKPDDSGSFSEFRGRTFIEREDGSQLETPDVKHFPTEADGICWLESE